LEERANRINPRDWKKLKEVLGKRKDEASTTELIQRTFDLVWRGPTASSTIPDGFHDWCANLIALHSMAEEEGWFFSGKKCTSKDSTKELSQKQSLEFKPLPIL
jgi:hypothetical protein